MKLKNIYMLFITLLALNLSACTDIETVLPILTHGLPSMSMFLPILVCYILHPTLIM